MWGNNMRQKTATNMVRQAEHRIESLVRIIGLVGLMTLAVACSRNSEITAEELPGIWKVVDGRGYFQFDGDGTYRWANTIEGLEYSVFEEGQYTMEGALLTYISSEESTFCEADQRGIYEIERNGEGEIRRVLQDEECRIRSNIMTGNLERVQ